MRFDGALHEFDTINGAAEDVTDIILNLKDLVIVSGAEEPITLRVDVRGPTDVLAGDVQTRLEIEILNKDLKLATLSAKGRLAFEMTIERGPGLPLRRSAEPHRHHRHHPYRRDLLAGAARGHRGRAPPAWSSPPTSTAWSRHRDRQVDQPARWLRPAPRCAPWCSSWEEMSEPGAGARAVRPGRGLRPARPRRAHRGARAVRTAAHCLKRAQINSIELIEKTEDDLLAITNFGQKSLDEVLAKLDEARPVAARQGLVTDRCPHDPARPAGSVGAPR